MCVCVYTYIHIYIYIYIYIDAHTIETGRELAGRHAERAARDRQGGSVHARGETEARRAAGYGKT